MVWARLGLYIGTLAHFVPSFLASVLERNEETHLSLQTNGLLPQAICMTRNIPGRWCRNVLASFLDMEDCSGVTFGDNCFDEFIMPGILPRLLIYGRD